MGYLKRVDLLRHELKALRFILDHRFGERGGVTTIPREDFQSSQGRRLYDAIIGAAGRTEAAARIRALDLEDVDVESFLRLSGEHYYSYPALVSQRAKAIRAGDLQVEEE